MLRSIGAVVALAFGTVVPAMPAWAQDSSIHMVSYIDAAPAARSQVTAQLRALVAASRKGAGLVRFEILQRTSPVSQFVLLETWKDEAAFNAQLASAHHKQFRTSVATHLISPVDDRLSVPTLLGPSQPSRGGAVVYVVTHVDVPGAVRAKALDALTALAGPSRKDAGNLRFDVVHQKNRTNHFTVVEVWRDQKASDAHELAAHTRAFRATLVPLTGALYDQRWYKGL